MDNYKKVKIFQSPEIQSKALYKVDKWYFMRRDDLTAYYERFFLDKVLKLLILIFQEVEKLRKRNSEGGKK